MLTLPAHAESVENNITFVKDTKTAKTAAESMALHSETLRQLMQTLYLDNPKLLRISTQVSIEEMVQWSFEGPFNWKFDGVRRLQGVDALKLAVDADFPGDRVLALIAGLHTMLAKAYGAKNEYDFSGDIYPQYLYNVARNIEVVSGKINQLNEANPDLPNRLVLLNKSKPADLTQKLRSLIDKVDRDANAFSVQGKQAIRPLHQDAAQAVDWQKTAVN